MSVAEAKASSITQEQRQRMEENRAAALARREAQKAVALGLHAPQDSSYPFQHQTSAIASANPKPYPRSLSHTDFVSHFHNSLLPSSHCLKPAASWKLAPCGSHSKGFNEIPSNRLEVSLELVSLREFVVITQSQHLRDALQTKVTPSQWQHLDQDQAPSGTLTYHLKDYDLVLQVIKGLPGIQLQQIPSSTLTVVQTILQAKHDDEGWAPFRPHHVDNNAVDQLLTYLPSSLKEVLLPFQLEGVTFGLRRGGRCLIADEMGVGKTIQAIAMASCYIHEGSVLVVCPASLRPMWAEEFERWLPFLSPTDVHLVFGRRNNLLENMETPKVVVISYTMLHRLRKDMQARSWAMLIVDESHNLRCTKKKLECDETRAVLYLAQNVKRLVLLSGTPSLSRPFDIFHQVECLWPGLLGRNKYDFAKNYCHEPMLISRFKKSYKDFAKGIRLQELNVLLRETIMVRRLKDDVLAQLPPKRRQVIRLKLNSSDLKDAKTACANNQCSEPRLICKCGFDYADSCDCEDDWNKTTSQIRSDFEESILPISLSYQEVGVAKLRGFREWLLNHPILSNYDDSSNVDNAKGEQKMVIFAHHHKVLDHIQEIVHRRHLQYIRIDGTTLSKDRQSSVDLFQSKSDVKIAVIGLTAGGVGLNFSAAQSVVFVELPKTASEMMQAEDRAHRRGQKNAVNVYIFCAKDTMDETQYQTLSKSLERVSTMTNGVDGALPGIQVDAVCNSSQFPAWSPGPVPDFQGQRMSKSSCNVLGNEDEIDLEQSGEAELKYQENDAATIVEPLSFYEKMPCHVMNTDPEGKIHQSINADNLEDRTSGCPAIFEPSTSKSEEQENEIFPHLLMFEVSSNTGRVHLYKRSTLDGLRPISLNANFRPEDLEGFSNNRKLEKGALPKFLVNSAANCNAASHFISEWNRLRAIQRKQLLGRPVQVPLSLELSCMKFGSLYMPGGLVKGGSRRRVTPKTELFNSLPNGAYLRKVTLSKHYRMEKGQVFQPWNSEGEPLCKFCLTPIITSKSNAPEYQEDLFCKIDCFEHYRMKTSQLYIRQELFALEQGKCTMCKLDCHGLVECIKHLSTEERRKYILQKAPEFQKYAQLLDKLVADPREGNAWHADHIVAVSEGGGECNLENMRTLCVICHRKVTAIQRRRRRSSLARAKNGLQITIEKLLARVCQKRMKLYSSQGSLTQCEDSSDSDADKDLLGVEIVGSAYSSLQTKGNDKSLENNRGQQEDGGV